MKKIITTGGIVLAMALMACDEAEESKGEASVDSTASVADESTYDSAALSPDVWLADRYGPEQGMIELEFETAGEKTTQIRYFRDHGRTEGLYWYANGPDSKPFASVLHDDVFRFRGVADTKVEEVRWSPDLPIALPNFRNLNDAMRVKYDLEELESREYLGRETKGYLLKSGNSTSRLWVWEGILLYGEVNGVSSQGIDPMVIRATSLDVETPVGDEKFVLE